MNLRKLMTAFTIFIILLAQTTNLTFAQYETLSSFSTNFNPGSVGRAANIKKAAHLINETVVYPGQTFSFNDTIGPTTQKRGFSLAKIFIKGKEADGYGGGVCQVSSTLFNAADEAGLAIVERHPHSKKVTYVPDDRDAATSYGDIDLRFRNDYDFPVIIRAAAYKNIVTVEIGAV